MNILFILGRLAFVVIFILSGAQKLMDIPGTAATIASKVPLPAFISAYTPELEAATGMTTPHMLAILVGVIEIGAALMIAANIGTRAGAVLLMLFTVAATYYFHDFWNMTGPAREANMVNALKNLSLLGGLLVFFVLGPWRPIMDRYVVDPAQRE